MCSVHRGIFSTSRVFSTLGEYHEYIGVLSTSEDTMSASGRGDIMNTLGMFSTLGDILMHVGDTMSTLGDVQYIRGYQEYIGGYHEYIGGYHEYIGGYHEYIGVFNRN